MISPLSPRMDCIDVLRLRARHKRALAADRIILPGPLRGDLAALSLELGMPVERGPDEVKDLRPGSGAAADASIDQIMAKIILKAVIWASATRKGRKP